MRHQAYDLESLEDGLDTIFDTGVNTYIDPNQGQMFRFKAERNRFDIRDNFAILQMIPLFTPIVKYISNLAQNGQFQQTTYSFIPATSSVVTKVAMKNTHALGLVNVAIGQSQITYDTTFIKKTIYSVILNVILVAAAYLTLGQATVASYEKFSYLKEALRTLYYERSDQMYDETSRASISIGEMDWKKDLQGKFGNRVSFKPSFASVMVVYLVESCCCCFKKLI